jgi:hypothetical protein
MTALAAIVARDAACGGPLPDSALPEYQVLADRRALVALLRSVFGAVETVAQYDEWAAQWIAEHPALAALDEPTP